MSTAPQASIDPQELGRCLAALRPTLLRLAQLQLRNHAWAEDAVSETVLAVLQGAQRFNRASQLKTWIVGILKHKVLDQLRQHMREPTVLAAADDDEDELEHLLFKQDGHFRELPDEWADPCVELQRTQFFAVLEACLEYLPNKQGRVFLMREWLQLDSNAICQELGIAPTNLWVMLHRARLRLRECLQIRWFTPGAR
ncbi:RNA polymerase sigma-24 related protein [mine drainage metagenome]|uniref:RNA polymerase sigma-24 related protein n=1 Tax=mine drainage metagenome TaxID=410659 RepID=T1C4C5_9ZZZZ